MIKQTYNKEKYRILSELGFAYSVDSKIAGISGMAKDRLAKKYTVKGGDYNFNVFSGELRYNVSHSSGSTSIDVNSSDNPLNPETLKKDMPFCFDVMETLVDSSCEAFGKKVDLEIYPAINLFEKKQVTEFESFFKKENKTAEKIEKESLKTGFDNIGGCEEAKEELQRVGYGIKRPEIYKEWGLEQPKGVLLYGPPGTGKTLLAKATAKEVGANFYSVKGAEVTSMWFGESEKNIKNMFDAAKADAPSILFIDEIDSIAPSRDTSSEASRRMVGALLEKMDGMESVEGVMVMGATNRLTAIDPALLRPGRFDEKIEVPLPDAEGIKQIYQIQLKGRKVGEGISYQELARKSDSFSGADIKAVVNNALKKKIDEIRKGGSPRPVSTEELIESIEEYRKKAEKLNGGVKDAGTYNYIS